jgi:hypothetical protein
MIQLKTVRTLLILGVSLFTISSCKKDKAKSKTDLITAGGWKLVKAEEKVGTGAWIDDTGSYSACEKDDVMIFNSNATYEANEGATKCSPTDPQIQETGTWSFESDETKLKTTSGGFSYTVSIDQLDENTFVTTETYSSGGITSH